MTDAGGSWGRHVAWSEASQQCLMLALAGWIRGGCKAAFGVFAADLKSAMLAGHSIRSWVGPALGAGHRQVNAITDRGKEDPDFRRATITMRAAILLYRDFGEFTESFVDR